MKATLTFLIFLFSHLLNAQTQRIILPGATDPNAISPNDNHFVYINTAVTQKNKLFLFFPGTGGIPSLYKEILKVAANLGYHSIGLTYPNALAINSGAVCGNTVDTTCHSRARYEVFDGVDRNSSINVDSNNCIQNRTIKLLQYLETQYPSENWGQYFTGDSIIWNKIIVSGHSQGGGHAGFISKIKEVSRVVMFAATDKIALLNRDADWITWSGPTPSNRYYGFVHENDEAVPFATLQYTWTNYGMFNYGSLILADTTISPYTNSHTLYTQVTPKNDATKFHNCIAVDYYTPFDNNGVPVLKSVWEYLIEDPIASGINEFKDKLALFTIYPNPANEILSISFDHCQNMKEQIEIYNAVGVLIKVMELAPTINIAEFQRGLYFVQLRNHPEKRLKFIKL